MGLIEQLEQDYPEGSDLTIMNTHYDYPAYEDGKKLHDDSMIIIYKDNKTHKKNFKIISKPDYIYYKLKDPKDHVYYNRLFIEKDKVEPVKTPFIKLDKDIAEKTGQMDFYNMNIQNRNKYNNRLLHTDPDIFFSDSNIEDHYRFRFDITYKNDPTISVSKGFFDIEVDGKFAAGEFVEMGECEINCVTYLDEASCKATTFILRNIDNPLIKEFEDEITSGKFGYRELLDFIKEAVGDDNFTKYNLDKLTFDINFYDKEIELLSDLFATIHAASPDFVEGWNSSGFDLNYIIARIMELGYEPSDIMCDRRWPLKIVKHFVDERNKNEFAERGDYTFISGLPVWIDQMIQYASRRKSKIGSIKSFKLDDIGEKEAKVKKLDYSHITKSVTELPWLDFKTFVIYNIMDTVVQKCIEDKTQDIEYIFSKCIINNTVYRKGHRQTVYLVNRMAKDWYQKGFIIGNNVNFNNPEPDKFKGALVGDPLKTNNYSKIYINGTPIWVCDNLIDYDFKALYPSTMSENNIAPNTQIGKIIIPTKVYDHENIHNGEKYSREGEFIDNMVTDNMIEFCHRWFHLANFQEFIKDIDEYFYQVSHMYYSEWFNRQYIGNKYLYPIKPTSNTVYNPITMNNAKISRPIKLYTNRDPQYTYDNLYKVER